MGEDRYDLLEIMRYVEKAASGIGMELQEIEREIEEVESVLELLKESEQEYTYLVGELNAYLG